MTAHTLAALQGRWYGIYPASGIELIEASYDASANVLTGTKLTGNDFVRAGRASWKVSLGTCKVVSSLWQGVYSPRWDSCKLRVLDADHLQILLPLGDDVEEVLNFVRATLPQLLQWDEAQSPTHGFYKAMVHCGISPEDATTTLFESLREALHHTHGTVIIDQLLLVIPFLLIGGWQLRDQYPTANWLLLPLVAMFGAFLCLRLNYLGIA